MSPPNDIPAGLRRLLDDEGAEVAATRPIDHGTQYDLVRDGETAKLNVYRTGKVSAGGRASRLIEVLEGWRTGEGGVGGRSRKPAAGPRPALDGTPRLGIDEAGKGDFFGPLVVAGVRVTGGEMAAELREIGVRDSKTVGVLGARPMAERILEATGPENVRVVVLGPEEYETRRRAAGNVNDLLGEVDAGIIHELEDEVEVIVVDQYAKSARARLAPAVPPGVRLEVRPRAEDDAAVAAASILARARQLEEVDRLSETVGFRLPLGATHVIDAGRRVVRELGEDGLAKVAKVHFATTKRVIGEDGGTA
ncbi:MAG: Ribonuclease HIII [uncultured Rubrobacteraceae bacterium]|uniref:Ribonuclease n=1 Tax=uncultured Rubrobacteraceae bacterium TaxID=349277 RepID=A0A6J4NRY3_9ACTN|nr:MAG: Ribonuclease HIII [uncultured Rubrobacteraceae bacterium]